MYNMQILHLNSVSFLNKSVHGSDSPERNVLDSLPKFIPTPILINLVVSPVCSKDLTLFGFYEDGSMWSFCQTSESLQPSLGGTQWSGSPPENRQVKTPTPGELEHCQPTT